MKTKFICEITNLYENYHSLNDLKEFICLLEEFGDYVEVSFVSENNIETLIDFVASFEQKSIELNSKIVLGYQYGKSKTNKSKNFDYLREFGDDVYNQGFNKIYLVTNSKLIAKMAKRQLEKNSPHSEIIIINEIEFLSLQGINEHLKNFIPKRLIRTKIK